MWNVYSWTGLSPACSPTAGELILAIAENNRGERRVVRISPEYQNRIHIGVTGWLETDNTETGPITTFVPTELDDKEIK